MHWKIALKDRDFKLIKGDAYVLTVQCLKCKEIFLKDPAGGSTVTIIAGLTNVPSADFPDISKIVGVGRDATVTTL